MKSIPIKRSVFIPAILIAGLFLASVAMAAEFSTKASRGGGVMVDVVPVQLAAGQPARFLVRLNTHTTPLDQDLTAVAELRDDHGVQYKPVQWDGTTVGGHHRRGTLVFPKLKAPVSSVTLTIHNIGGIPSRDFAWQLQP